MDLIALARLQFGITSVYHFFFVPLTIGLSTFVAIMQTLHFRTGDDKYQRMTVFWGKLLLINFAVGVVTGIVQEFQFGMNWSEYSRFVGDIFGAPLAVEALVAFFVESTFLGLWIFGSKILSKRVHLLTIWLVALASCTSAFWILVANSFMQNPVGYHVVASGQAEMTDFFALLANPNVWLQWPHVLLGGLATAAFFVIGISAYRLLRVSRGEQEREVFGTSMRLGLILGIVAVIGSIAFGHLQSQRLAETQPMKLAAAEGLWESESPAGLSLFQIGDEANRRAVVNISIPGALSFLTYYNTNGLVRGINQLQGEFEQAFGPGVYSPPAIWLTYWSFRIMVFAGFLMLALGLLGLWLGRGQHVTPSWFLRVAPLAIALPYIANSSGWMLTEFGRLPWIVYGLMRVENAVSPNVGFVELLISVVGFTLIYGLLAGVAIFLLRKFARARVDGPVGLEGSEETLTEPPVDPRRVYLTIN